MDLDGFGWIWGLSLQVNNMGTSLWELNGDLPGMRFASINASKNPYLVAKILFGSGFGLGLSHQSL